MIEDIRTYIATCNLLDQYTAINVDYLVDKVKAYSISESPAYNPIISEDITEIKHKQCLFSFDSKFYWNEEVANNISNLNFYDNFSKWLEYNSDRGILPTLNSGLVPTKIQAITNGYIFQTKDDEAIYRIQCVLYYDELYNNDIISA